MKQTSVAVLPKPPADFPLPRRLWAFGLLALVVFLLGLAGGSYQGKLGSVQKNDNAAYLPASAESTKVDNQSQAFSSIQSIPGFIVYQRVAGLSAADKAKIEADAGAFRSLPGVDADRIGAAQYSADGRTANVSVPLIGKTGATSIAGDVLVTVEKRVIKTARANAPPGLVIHSAGPGGLIVAFIDSFSGIDGTLLLAAGLVVIIILLVVYRSPILWFFPLFSAVLALGAAALVIYPLAKNNVLTLNGQSQGILSVLVLGAGTDYALLLISRYREELHNYAGPNADVRAMVRAWRGTAPPIAASAVTVILGLLCLSFGELNSDRSLGPVCAIGIACTGTVMLVFLPAALLVVGRYAYFLLPTRWPGLIRHFGRRRNLGGRWLFWPRIPHSDLRGDLATHGVWGAFAAALGRRARFAWTITTFVLLAAVLGVPTLRTGGLSVTQSFTNTPDAIVGQKLFDASFPQGSGAPAVIMVNTASTAQVIQAVSRVPGVASTPGSVCVQPDYAKVAAAAGRSGGSGQLRPGPDGCLPPALSVAPRNGRTVLNATLVYRYDTAQANATIVAMRAAVHPIAGAGALVGGASAVNYDTQSASRHDRDLIIPIVLLVIVVVLGLVLRSLLAPLLLIATVVLSFAATLGVSALMFNHVFHFANADPSFPLFAFVFLVALGIDYNIFLMTRVREETLVHGTRAGVLRGLAVTGGVITSAGAVLAATFGVLGVLPLVFLSELGFAVAFGVLMDTILVRSVLVPALSHDLGSRIWWPSRLDRTPS